jgi:hypothetical protein
MPLWTTTIGAQVQCFRALHGVFQPGYVFELLTGGRLTRPESLLTLRRLRHAGINEL